MPAIRSMAAFVVWIAAFWAPAVAQAIDRPNFVIIMADDLGWGDLSCYDGWIESPAIDKLARRGVRLTDFHSSGVVCSPTRAGLMTGRYQQRAGIGGVINANADHPAHDDGLQANETTFAELLGAAGYKTGLIGKWHLGYTTNYSPQRRGFDFFRGYVSGNVDYFAHRDGTGRHDWWHGETITRETGYSTHLITQHAVEFIEEYHQQPFCLAVMHEAPHYPYQGPNDEGYRTEDGNFPQHGIREDRKEAYREMVTEMDRGIGEIVQTIERLDLSQRTLIWFFSDNGATNLGSNAPWRGHKGTHWEGGHRVPSVAVWPGVIPAGEKRSQMGMTIDVMPTMLAAANVAVPQELKLDGIDMLPILANNKTQEQRKLYWNGRAMRDGPWKLIIPKGRSQSPQLFHLENDPGESNNLASQEPERLQSMLGELRAWHKEVTSQATPQP